jgi:tRNA threonylcarbamoyladenosine biosynthesis protein TsaB
MYVLGIDTSTPCGSVGLANDSAVISEYLLTVPVTHSERLLAAIHFVLKEAGCAMEALDGWAVSLGPGSFTGLRIGVSTVKGLAFATGKPVVGVPTLDGLAAQISPTPYLICPILDARKKEVYTAFYRYNQENLLVRLSDYQAIRPDVLMKEVKEKTIFVGNGAIIYGEILRTTVPSFALFPAVPLHLLHGSMVAKLGIDLLLKKDTLDTATFSPIYVRPSEAEIKWQERRLK